MNIAVIGDSVAIDLYPELDAAERFGKKFKRLGAASLLLENNDELFPEFAGKDLKSISSELKFYNLAEDGGTLSSIPRQVAKIRDPEALDLLFVSVGGNDLLQRFSKPITNPRVLLGVLLEQYKDTVQVLLSHFPNAEIILSTVYDPTDGSGMLSPNQAKPLPIELLHIFNQTVKSQAGREGRVKIANIWAAFLGNGISIMKEGGQLNNKGYYWAPSIIEPNVFGASKIRELWLQHLIAG